MTTLSFFFYFSKVFHFIIDPLSWMFFLIIIALLLKDPIKKRRILKMALFIFWIFTNAFTSNEAARVWEFKPRELDSLGVYKAGIVLGGLSYYDREYNRIVFRGCPDRLMQALSLYKQKKIQKIIFSGGSGYIHDDQQTEGVFVYQYLRSLNIPPEDLVFENTSRNTRENAKNTKIIIDSLGWKDEKMLLITSCNHMMRARGCFNRVNIKTDLYPVDRIGMERQFYAEKFILPSMEALVVWRQVIHEFFGYITYKIAGYI